MHMNRKILLLITCLFLWSFCSAVSAKTWTDAKGNKIQAELVRVSGSSVVLKTGGKQKTLNIAALSNQDQQYLRQRAAKTKAPRTSAIRSSTIRSSTTRSSTTRSLTRNSKRSGRLGMTVIRKSSVNGGGASAAGKT